MMKVPWYGATPLFGAIELAKIIPGAPWGIKPINACTAVLSQAPAIQLCPPPSLVDICFLFFVRLLQFCGNGNVAPCIIGEYTPAPANPALSGTASPVGK